MVAWWGRLDHVGGGRKSGALLGEPLLSVLKLSVVVFLFLFLVGTQNKIYKYPVFEIKFCRIKFNKTRPANVITYLLLLLIDIETIRINQGYYGKWDGNWGVSSLV